MPKIYKVGGCVRDRLLDLDPKDYDFVFVTDDNETTIDDAFQGMINYLKENKYKVFLVTSDCFTVKAKFPIDHPFEGLTGDFVLARKEIGYLSDSRKPICIPGTLLDDLERRDFTVNAMAEDEDEEIIDPFDGQEDLNEMILKTPVDPIKSFGDDPLRLLRAMRFVISKGFTMSEECEEAFNNPELWYKLKTTVSKERIREELFKCFSFDTIKTLRYLQKIDNLSNGTLEFIFSGGLWLKPTLETKK
jgi:tRNA nucleotidyltransferase/poly(A) polymerase